MGWAKKNLVAGVGGIMVVAALTGCINNPQDPNPADSSSPSAAMPSQTNPSNLPAEKSPPPLGQCPAKTAGGPELLTATWQIQGTAQLPLKSPAGPCRFTEAGAPVGFAIDAAGAVTAAQWFAGGLNLSGVVPKWRDRLASSVADSPGKAIMTAAAERVESKTDPAPAPGSSTRQTCGYRLPAEASSSNYSEAGQIRVDLLICAAQGSSVAGLDGPTILSIDVVNVGGDWKLVPALNGQVGTGTPATTTTGFVPWGAPDYAGRF